MTFWHDAALEPKRAYRYNLYIGGGNNELTHYLVQKVSRPSFSTTESAHKYLNHTFYYPGKMEWETTTFTITDAISPNAAQKLMAMLEASGYKAPIGTNAGIDDAQTVSKSKARDALGNVKIVQIDADNNIIEEWIFHNAWIKDVKFADLDYDSDDLLNIEVTLRYDFAALNVKRNPSGDTGVFPSNAPKI